MERKARTSDVAGFLGKYPRPIQQIVTALRRLIRKSVPGVVETVNPQRRRIRYRVTDGGRTHYFCHLAPFDDHVRLGFEFGALLADPGGLLTGKAKRTRHAIITKSADLQREEMGMMVAEAALVAVNHGHAIV
jgi:hypothetical protein